MRWDDLEGHCRKQGEHSAGSWSAASGFCPKLNWHEKSWHATPTISIFTQTQNREFFGRPLKIQGEYWTSRGRK